MNIEQFLSYTSKININVTETQLEQLNTYFEMLVEYNKVMNLTGITEKEQVYLKHFYDSLTLHQSINLYDELTICDVGTGAGFPGMVLKIVFPNLKVTLVDSLNKRLNFLNDVINKLDLKNIECIHSRAEDYAKNNRCKFDIVTARAVAPLNILLEYCVPLVKEDKYFIPMKANIEEELDISKSAMKKLNVIIEEKIQFLLPFENSNRTLIKFKKTKDNPLFPRENKEIKKNPL